MRAPKQSPDEVVATACSGCGATMSESHRLPYPPFRHLDFAEMSPGPIVLEHCRACGLVSRRLEQAEARQIASFYCSAAYVGRHEPEQTVAVEGADHPVARSALQAQLLAPFVPEESGRVLDIGCGRGNLVAAIAAKRPHARLTGIDVADQPGFPARPNIRFVKGSIGDVDGPFDVIALSHSLQYIHDLGALFAQVRVRLARRGALFVQVPDFRSKPCSLLLGDLHHHFSPAILTAVLERAGFRVETPRVSWFPRDALIVARHGEPVASAAEAEEDALPSALAEIERLAAALAAFAEAGPLGVLGTTIEAAFADSRATEAVAFFVDENPARAGTTFRGKPVVAPQDVRRHATVLVPMGANASAIAARLSAAHSARFVAP